MPKTESKNGNELVTLMPDQYPAIANGKKALAVIQDNLAGEEVTPHDLTKIKVPAGGATTWLVNGLSGDEEAHKTLEGVIVHITRQRAYWDPDASLGSGVPLCNSSGSCLVGSGKPGGDCKACSLNQFGTSVNDKGEAGRGKACKETKLVFLLRKGRTLPDVVVASPASLKNLRQYQLQLGVPYWAVLTRLELEKQTSAGGEPYARIKPFKTADLAPDTATSIMVYAQALQNVFNAVEVTQDDVTTGEAAPVTAEV